MSNSDLWIRDLITSYGLPTIILILIAISISQNWPRLRKCIYKCYLTGFEAECAELMAPYKKCLFESLQHVVSSDGVLRAMGCIRLLEIGVKTGVHLHGNTRLVFCRLNLNLAGENIQFYPDSTHLIAVDRNVKLAEYLIKGNRSWEFSHIIIERLIIGDGSSLKEIPTGHVDIVVSTRSLCSVTSTRSTLKEIRRVLAPGGQYLFIEHVPENEGTFIRCLQKVLSRTRVWPSLFGGCNLDVDPIVDIKNAGFYQITWDTFTLEGYVSQYFHFILSKQHVLGIAVR